MKEGRPTPACADLHVGHPEELESFRLQDTPELAGAPQRFGGMTLEQIDFRLYYAKSLYVFNKAVVSDLVAEVRRLSTARKPL